MSSIETNKPLSPTLSNLIAEVNYSIENVKEKILTAYDYAIDKDGFTPKEAAKLLRDKLEYSDSYIRKVLPLEAKDQSKTNKPSDAILESHKSQETDKDVVNITTAYDVKDAETKEEEYKPSSAMEEFRKQHGTVEEQEQEEQEQDTIYDKDFVENLIKENTEQKDLIQNIKKEKVEANMAKSYTSEYDIEFSDDDLMTIRNNAGICPLTITSYPEKKQNTVRFDRSRLNKKKK